VSTSLTEARPRRSWHDAVFNVPVGILAAVQFLTVAPPLIRRPLTPAELGRSVGWFPLVGIGLGAALAGADLVVGLLVPPGVAAALVLATWVVTTGALHLDGFLDCCDGLFGGHSPEARLRIMRDERVGAYAVTGGVLLMILKYACLTALAGRAAALVVAPMVGRWAMAVAVVAFPYARAEGLGRAMKDHAGWLEATVATVTALAGAALLGGWWGGLALGAAIPVAGAGVAFALRRLPGLTGDVYGALCELVEVMTLLVFLVEAQS
jgi:adenosylcobinamide-GDP ribazoletransferase